MSTPEIIFLCIVLFVGVPAMWRNATAAALVLSWAVGQMVWVLSGDSLPLKAYVMADIGVIVAILGKTIVRCGDKIYKDGWHQLRCMFTDLTPQDRGIVLIFLLFVWPIYILTLDEFAKWWTLWLLTALQFFLAGTEAFLSWREAKRADPVVEPDSPSAGGFMRLARVGGYD